MTLKFGTRRDFLSLLGMTAAGAAFGSMLKPSIAWAAPGPNGPSTVEIYIKIFLNGGVDGLYFVPPKDPTYFNALRANRPLIMGSQFLNAASQVLDLGTAFGLHPYLGPACPVMNNSTQTTLAQLGLSSIYDMIAAGDGKVLPRIGFPTPDLNHPSAVDPWNIGAVSFDRSTAHHWEARLMQQAGYAWNQMWLLGSPGGMVPYRPMSGQTAPVATRFLKQLTRFTSSEYDGWKQGHELGTNPEISAAQQAIEQIMQLPDETGAPVTIKRYKASMLDSLAAIDSVAPITNTTLPAYFPEYQYPDGFDENIRDVAKVIYHHRIRLGQSKKLLFHVGFNGFDTHGQTGATQDDLLIPRMIGINHCMAALRKFLVDNNLWQKTAIQFVSDFGRAVRQDPLGTAHAHASNLLVLGGAVSNAGPKVVGGSALLPTINDLANPLVHGGSTILTSAIDPRDVTWELIQALGDNPAAVLTGYTPQRTLNLFA